MSENSEETEFYGDPGIASNNRNVPFWLIVVYMILPIWGVITLYLFWNGSYGWLDRGYWQALQEAANTTFPAADLTLKNE